MPTRTRNAILASAAATLAIAATLAAAATLVPAGSAWSAPPACPTAEAVSAALRTKATGTSDCEYEIGGFDKLSIELVAAPDVAKEMASRRADALRHSAPVAKTKVGPFRAFTGAAAEQSRLSYDQKGTFVYMAATPIEATSAGDLQRIGAALAKITLPKEIAQCDAINAAVTGAIPRAAFDHLSNSTCVYKLPGDATIMVGTDTESTFDERFDEFRLFTQRPKLTDVKVKAHKGFVYQTGDTTLVLGLADSVAIVTINKKQSPLATSWPVKVAGLLP